MQSWRYHSWIRDRGIRISNDWTGEVHTQAIAFPFEAAWFRGTPHWDAWVYRAECEAISRLAGPVAEWKYQGRSLTRPLYTSDEANPNADLNVVGALVDAILGEPDRPHRLYQFLLQQDTKRILRHPRTWAAVGELSRELVAQCSVSGERAFEIFHSHRVPTVQRLWVEGKTVFHPTNALMIEGERI